VQRLSQVARTARFAAMHPAAITERQALDRALAATPHQPEQIVLSRPSADPQRTWWLHDYCSASTDQGSAVCSFWRDWNLGQSAAWHVNANAYDANGTRWERGYMATVDDFGNLVEVAQ